MSVWRRKAIALLPEMRQELEVPDTSIYEVMSILAVRCLQAHASDDRHLLARIYEFVDWCARQEAKDLWNAAGVSFFEEIVESEAVRREFHKWVPHAIFLDVQGLIRARVGGAEVESIQRAYVSGAA